eukprot:COSAG03_NODE_1729_length_3596_cov_3.943094_5_plen_108_part_00
MAALVGRSVPQGEPWLDTAGHVIDAHGGGMLEDAGTYYWYGSARQSCAKGGNRSVCGDRDAGINLYKSTDLYSWEFVSTVVRAFNGSATDNGNDLERPKVVRCGAPH